MEFRPRRGRDFLRWLFGRGGLKRTILVPFASLILLGLGLGWLSYYVGSRQAVLRAVDLLALEAASRVGDRLRAYLGGAADLAAANAAMIAGLDDQAGALPRLCRSFRLQLLGRSDVDLVCVGFADGEYAEAQRLPEGRVRIGRAGRATGGALLLESSDAEGRPAGLELRRPGYDPRERPWYKAAAAAGRPTWSAPYPIVSSGEYAMAAASPIYAQGRLAAVATADLRLGAVSDFLAEAARERGGLAFAVDGTGTLIASSEAGSGASGAELISASWPSAGRPLRARIDGVAYRAVSLPVPVGEGLGWSVVVALPEASFLAPMARNDLRTGLLLVASLAGALALAFLSAHRIAEPLISLGQAVARIEPALLGAPGAAGEAEAASRELRLLSASREDEIGRLAAAFDGLSQRLVGSFASLRSSLAEKEILLKEVHHRVKNNLQIVSSLLSLHAECCLEGPEREGLIQLQDRVQAMAFVHEDMYGSGHFDSVRMDAYFQRICESLSASRRISCPISLRVEPSELALSLEKALPCGLIVSELVTNALKHAFTGRACGEVLVSLALEEGKVRVVVSDDGIGLSAAKAAAPAGPPERKAGAGGGIGASLVEGLSSQLKGRLETETSAAGTKVCLVFPAG